MYGICLSRHRRPILTFPHAVAGASLGAGGGDGSASVCSWLRASRKVLSRHDSRAPASPEMQRGYRAVEAVTASGLIREPDRVLDRWGPGRSDWRPGASELGLAPVMASSLAEASGLRSVSALV